ncbi:hypothetical protein [Streptacidiphilus sp. P02-A3a]|uniref:hypothetical protein n=1 Tax=Streptacidiphilus sp. P02-A3a TaxID=2704468 RepID=UPI0015FCF785|nr:hypothetical protein [Streptacidiphilus sp. P02-A3a]QMU72685.1 hypothetical protein GXP74_35005 [Streptacidiphilus sp. P02-A3a]
MLNIMFRLPKMVSAQGQADHQADGQRQIADLVLGEVDHRAVQQRRDDHRAHRRHDAQARTVVLRDRLGHPVGPGETGRAGLEGLARLVGRRPETGRGRGRGGVGRGGWPGARAGHGESAAG